jgi:hypothetical protein
MEVSVKKKQQDIAQTLEIVVAPLFSDSHLSAVSAASGMTDFHTLSKVNIIARAPRCSKSDTPFKERYVASCNWVNGEVHYAQVK